MRATHQCRHEVLAGLAAGLVLAEPVARAPSAAPVGERRQR